MGQVEKVNEALDESVPEHIFANLAPVEVACLKGSFRLGGHPGALQLRVHSPHLAAPQARLARRDRGNRGHWDSSHSYQRAAGQAARKSTGLKTDRQDRQVWRCVHIYLKGGHLCPIWNYSKLIIDLERSSPAGLVSLVVWLGPNSQRPSLPRHLELYHSNCGDAVTLAIVPSEPETTLSNQIFETGMKGRLLIEPTPVTPSERQVPGLPQGVHLRGERAGAGSLRR